MNAINPQTQSLASDPLVEMALETVSVTDRIEEIQEFGASCRRDGKDEDLYLDPHEEFLDNRLQALERMIASTEPKSIEGVAVHLIHSIALINTAIEFDELPKNQHRMGKRGIAMLYAALRAIEDQFGIDRAVIGGEYYACRRLDPFLASRRSPEDHVPNRRHDKIEKAVAA